MLQHFAMILYAFQFLVVDQCTLHVISIVSYMWFLCTVYAVFLFGQFHFSFGYCEPYINFCVKRACFRLLKYVIHAGPYF